jgi:hypothetical protein
MGSLSNDWLHSNAQHLLAALSSWGSLLREASKHHFDFAFGLAFAFAFGLAFALLVLVFVLACFELAFGGGVPELPSSSSSSSATSRPSSASPTGLPNIRMEPSLSIINPAAKIVASLSIAL